MRTDRQAGRALSRREFLRLAGIAGIATPLASAVFASCSNGGAGTTTATGAASSFGSGGIQVAGVPYPLARPHAPVTWNLHADNPAIRSGLAPESRMLKVIGYPDSVYQLVLDEFQTRYSTKVEWYDVSTPEEMLARVQPDPSAFDLICAAALDQVGALVAGRLIQPLNHSYLSNFGNIWSSYQDPFYDRRDRYTIPYTVYTTGIVWRNDLVSVDISSMLNPYEIFWDTAYKGKVRVPQRLTRPRVARASSRRPERYQHRLQDRARQRRGQAARRCQKHEIGSSTTSTTSSSRWRASG